MKRKIILAAILAGALAVSTYFLIGKGGGAEKNQSLSSGLKPQISEADGISFEAVPLNFNLQNPVKFKITIDTHSGSLDFDLMDISALEDDLGNQYQPLSWEGSPSGGHHRSGILSFTTIDESAGKIKLTIGSADRQIFEWQIK